MKFKELFFSFLVLLSCFQFSQAQNGASFEIPFAFIVGCSEPIAVSGMARLTIHPFSPANGNQLFTFNVNAKGTGQNLITGEVYTFKDNYHVTDHAGLVVNDRQFTRLKSSSGKKVNILSHLQITVDANFQLKHFSFRGTCEEK